ncbi:MAG: MCP four helix bundle domain-containing protein [Burkholderiales bacterium]|nr:MCP four helix bundle domain-containing protein [Burkholderiales bacterium]
MFSKLKIGQRLGWSFGAIVLSGLIGSVVTRSVLSEVSDTTQKLVSHHMAAVQHLNDIKDNLNQVARSSRNLLLMTTPADLKSERDAIDAAIASNSKIYSQLDQMELDAKSEALIKTIEDTRKAFNTKLQTFLAAATDDRTAALDILLQQVRPVQLAYMKKADELTDLELAAMTASAKQVSDQAAFGSWLSIGLNLAAALMAGVLAWFITRSVTKPLGEAVEIAHAVANGDLTKQIDVHGHDEISALLRALQTMTGTLQNLIGQLKAAADEIATGSGEIAKGNQDLSHRTEQQAANLQETAASMEQLSSTVRQTADASQQANDLATQASSVAARGATVMQEVVENMSDIATSSRKIGDIISVIDGIAFQTNILALNAAVEAARAGEQGRGFAVVAGEVRTLAQRSANAAKEIKGLITASVEKVDSGSALVGTAGDTMRDIETQIKRVADLIGDINSASTEQNSGIQQVHLAVSELDKVTQQNAALVEESAAAAESLKTQADQLTQSVQTFRL